MRSLRSAPRLAAVLALAGCSLGTGPATDGSSPQIIINSPADGATVGGSVPIDLTVTDDFGVDKVSVFIDNALKVEMFTPPFRYVWNTQALVSPSSHPIRVEALDLARNKATRQITVTVQNGVQAPPTVPR